MSVQIFWVPTLSFTPEPDLSGSNGRGIIPLIVFKKIFLLVLSMMCFALCMVQHQNFFSFLFFISSRRPTRASNIPCLTADRRSELTNKPVSYCMISGLHLAVVLATSSSMCCYPIRHVRRHICMQCSHTEHRPQYRRQTHIHVQPLQSVNRWSLSALFPLILLCYDESSNGRRQICPSPFY